MKDLKAQIVTPFGLTWQDYPDDESLSVIVYFLGCDNFCTNCHNPLFKTQNYPNSKEYTMKQFYNELYETCYKNKTTSVIFSGGDPTSSMNIEFTKYFTLNYGHIFNICIYTGHDIEYVKRNKIKGFTYIKVGKFDENLKQESCKTNEYIQLASTNQEIYDCNYNLVSRKGRMNF